MLAGFLLPLGLVNTGPSLWDGTAHIQCGYPLSGNILADTNLEVGFTNQILLSYKPTLILCGLQPLGKRNHQVRWQE